MCETKVENENKEDNMKILVRGTYDVAYAAGCCGGAYDYDDETGCIQDKT